MRKTYLPDYWLTGAAGTSSFLRVEDKDSRQDGRNGSEDVRSDSTQSNRAAVVGLIICLVLVGGALLLVHKLRAMSELQDCVMEGRTNCAPIDTGR